MVSGQDNPGVENRSVCWKDSSSKKEEGLIGKEKLQQVLRHEREVKTKSRRHGIPYGNFA